MDFSSVASTIKRSVSRAVSRAVSRRSSFYSTKSSDVPPPTQPVRMIKQLHPAPSFRRAPSARAWDSSEDEHGAEVGSEASGGTEGGALEQEGGAGVEVLQHLSQLGDAISRAASPGGAWVDGSQQHSTWYGTHGGGSGDGGGPGGEAEERGAPLPHPREAEGRSVGGERPGDSGAGVAALNLHAALQGVRRVESGGLSRGSSAHSRGAEAGGQGGHRKGVSRSVSRVVSLRSLIGGAGSGHLLHGEQSLRSLIGSAGGAGSGHLSHGEQLGTPRAEGSREVVMSLSADRTPRMHWDVEDGAASARSARSSRRPSPDGTAAPGSAAGARRAKAEPPDAGGERAISLSGAPLAVAAVGAAAGGGRAGGGSAAGSGAGGPAAPGAGDGGLSVVASRSASRLGMVGARACERANVRARVRTRAFVRACTPGAMHCSTHTSREHAAPHAAALRQTGLL